MKIPNRIKKEGTYESDFVIEDDYNKGLNKSLGKAHKEDLRSGSSNMSYMGSSPYLLC
ncbi:MAG: hypothetical protein ACYCZ1_03475 [Candidatus Humimicrobiaceae bacterium]